MNYREPEEFAASWFVEALTLARQGFAWLGRRLALWPPLLPLLGFLRAEGEIDA